MAYALILDVSGPREVHETIMRSVRPQGVPKGLIVHIAAETDKGMRIIDVWESEADFDRFMKERLGPARDKALAEQRTSLGEHPPREEELKIVEIWGPGIDVKG